MVGIDLGTTNCAIGVWRDDKVHWLRNPLGDVLTPSCVAAEPATGKLVVGRTARDLVARDPRCGALRWKPDIASDRVFQLGPHTLTAVDLSAHVLDALRSDAERALGTVVDRAVITVPAYFDDAQRHATRKAAEAAGLVVERILNEPTAAAITYGLHRRAHESRFAVVDLGGGTFDVCVMELFEGVLAVRSVAGDGRLGGEDFTAALVELIAARAGVATTGPSAGLLYKRAETCKRALARWPQAEVVLPEAVTGAGERSLVVTAAEADAAWAPLLERLRAPLRAALRGAELSAGDLAEVVLVGGATRMPCIGRVVGELLGRTPIHHADPDLLVAEGAAIQGAMLLADAAVEDVVVTDVCAHSLGVDSSKTLGDRVVDGYFTPIIHRNTTIPTTQLESFATLHDYQRALTLVVREGESRRAADNRTIGELRVPLTKPGPAGREVQVRFTLDGNGMLEVEAIDVDGDHAVRKVFHRTGGEVTGPALEVAQARLRAARADPMDRPRYRDLHARAKLAWAEASAAERAPLDHLIDCFEAAVAGRAPAAIEQAYAALAAHCDRLDRGDRW